MPGVPERVLSLIESSGLSRHAFAQEIGLDDSKLSKSISGTRRFSSLDLARIAELSQVTVDWLITGEERPLAVAARTTGGSAGAALTSAMRYATLRADLATLGVDQQWQPLMIDVGAGRFSEDATALADAALGRIRAAERWITEESLPLLTEDIFGTDVAVADLGTDFDGLAVASADAKVIVLGTSAVPARQRFTLAHELGHLLAGDDQGVHLDRDIFDKAQARDPSEKRANAFASAFLMPLDDLRQAVGPDGIDEKSFARLACDLIVSPSALAYRLLQFRLIDAGTCDRLKSMTGARAASIADRAEEFARRAAESSTPRLPGPLIRDAYAAYESGAATLRPYASLLGVDVDELRDALESELGMPDVP